MTAPRLPPNTSYGQGAPATARPLDARGTSRPEPEGRATGDGPPATLSDRELVWLLFKTHGALLRGWEHAHHGTLTPDERAEMANLLDEASAHLRPVHAAKIDQTPPRSEGRHHYDA
jgi:hypothetical protein